MLYGERMISFILAAAALFVAPPGPDSAVTWGPTIHQIVVVKASTLMPPSLQHQILHHRREILRGCLDVLSENLQPDPQGADVTTAYDAVLVELRSRPQFEEICYGLGRLSALAGEFASPLRDLPPGSDTTAFRDFAVGALDTFPLVITHDGEEHLSEGSLSAYLQYVARRNSLRRELIAGILCEESDPETWRDQRSAAYGAGLLCYNDLVLDTARLWLYLWQEAGGEIGEAPYFRIPVAGAQQ